MSVVTPSEPVSSQQRARSARERLITKQYGEFSTRWSTLGVATASARGRHHRVNEDSHSELHGAAPVFVVADGVGGGAMAAWTSRKLVRDVHRSLERGGSDAAAVRDAFLAADVEIARHIADHSAVSGAATAVVCVGRGALRATWLVGWVGDCRVYRVGTAPAAHLVTRDDTYGHLGERPPPGGSLDDPARMIGNGAVNDPNVTRTTLNWDEMLVLVSDGVHKYVEPDTMARLLRDDTPLVCRCLRLVQAARINGSEDDATVLVIHRRPLPRARILRYGASLAAAFLAAALLMAWSLPAKGALTATPPPPAFSHVPTECSP
jgi:serine/threonine protein phosphatase PrpC